MSRLSGVLNQRLGSAGHSAKGQVRRGPASVPLADVPDASESPRMVLRGSVNSRFRRSPPPPAIPVSSTPRYLQGGVPMDTGPIPLAQQQVPQFQYPQQTASQVDPQVAHQAALAQHNRTRSPMSSIGGSGVGKPMYIPSQYRAGYIPFALGDNLQAIQQQIGPGASQVMTRNGRFDVSAPNRSGFRSATPYLAQQQAQQQQAAAFDPAYMPYGYLPRGADINRQMGPDGQPLPYGYRPSHLNV